MLSRYLSVLVASFLILLAAGTPLHAQHYDGPAPQDPSHQAPTGPPTDHPLATPPPEATAEGLGAADWDSLTRGQVVVRGRAKGDATTEAMQAVGFILIQSPAETAYSFLARHERQPEYSPCTKAVEILSREAHEGREGVKARETHKSLWITMRYTVDYVHDRGLREIHWALDQGARNDVKDNRGSWRVADLGSARSLVVYRIAATPGRLPRFLIDYFVRKRLPAFLRALREKVEAEPS